MKILEISSLQTGIDQILDQLRSHEEQLKQIEITVKGIISLEDSLKGSGGKSIRSFYENCHLTFLVFYQDTIDQYITKLTTIKGAFHSFEPVQNGFIRQSFLDNELEVGMNKAKATTVELTNEANSTIQSVQDIIALPKLQEDNFIQSAQNAQKRIDQTIEQLHTVDQEQTNALNSIEKDFQTMQQYIYEIQSLFQSGTLSIENYNPNQSYEANQEENTNVNHSFDSFMSNERVACNHVDASDTQNGLDMTWDPTPTLGFNFKDWREKPINAAANLGVLAGTAYGASKDVSLARQGFGVKRSTRVTHQGVEKVVLKVNRPELLNLNKKTYSGANATNLPRLYKYVDPLTKVKDSFKWASNKVGYIGVGATVAGDITYGIQNKQSTSEIAGNITGDVAIAGASIAASAAMGAQVGAYVGVLGGPVGVIAGTVAGAVLGVVVTSLLSDFKFMDVDNDGKSDSIGDAIKKGTTGLIDKIGSWF